MYTILPNKLGDFLNNLGVVERGMEFALWVACTAMLFLLIATFGQTLLYTARPAARVWVGTITTNILLSMGYVIFYYSIFATVTVCAAVMGGIYWGAALIKTDL